MSNVCFQTSFEASDVPGMTKGLDFYRIVPWHALCSSFGSRTIVGLTEAMDKECQA
jgi:hypothetical protein